MWFTAGCLFGALRWLGETETGGGCEKEYALMRSSPLWEEA
jgi:hypothetical protein